MKDDLADLLVTGNDQTSINPHTNSHGIGLIGDLAVGLRHHVDNERNRSKKEYAAKGDTSVIPTETKNVIPTETMNGQDPAK